MNKVAKASVAAGAGVVLLMGGAASLAYWNSSTELGAGGQSITAGTLTVTPTDPADGAWTKSFNGGTAADVADLSAVEVVPGNTIEYTETFEVDAAGEDLLFTVQGSEGAIEAASAAPADVALAAIFNTTGNSDFDFSDIDVDGNVALVGTTLPAGAGLPVYAVTANGVSDLTVTWTIDWPFGTAPASETAGDNAAKGGAVTLGEDGAVTLTQVATFTPTP